MTTAAVDTSMEGISLRQKRFAGEKSKVRRNLFGVEPADHERVNSILREELDKIDAEQIRKWNFDFKTDTPLEGEYKWEPVDSYVPKFYEAKVVVSAVPSRTSKYMNVRCSTSQDGDCSTRNVNPLNCIECRGQSTRPKRADPFSPISRTPSTPVQPKLNSSVSTPKTPSTSKCSNSVRATKPAKRQAEIREYLKQRKRRLHMEPASTKVFESSTDLPPGETTV